MNIENLPFLAISLIIALVVYWCYKEFSMYRREIIDIKREVIKLKNVMELELHEVSDDEESVNNSELNIINNPNVKYSSEMSPYSESNQNYNSDSLKESDYNENYNNESYNNESYNEESDEYDSEEDSENGSESENGSDSENDSENEKANGNDSGSETEDEGETVEKIAQKNITEIPTVTFSNIKTN